MKKHKQRLDQKVHELFPTYSRQHIQSWIMQGKVRVDGTLVTKAGTMISEDQHLSVDAHEPKFVSRAGFKLEKVLDVFNVQIEGKTALDAGISTGGFTDCMLQRGIAKVYGVDVGYGQVHEKVVRDQRLILMERTNLRTLPDLGQQVDLITLDLSFISVLKVMETVDRVLSLKGTLIVLIKPQFEAERHQIGRGGIIKDPEVHAAVIAKVVSGIESYGFSCQGTIDSPILGGSGNKEFLAVFNRIKKTEIS